VFVKSIREHNWAFKNNWFQNKPLLFFDCVSTAPFFFLFFFPFSSLRDSVRVTRVTCFIDFVIANASASQWNRGWCSFFRKVYVTHSLSARVSLSPQNIHVFRALVYSLSLCIYSSQFFCLRTSANTFAAENYSFDSIFTFLFPLHFYNWLSIF